MRLVGRTGIVMAVGITLMILAGLMAYTDRARSPETALLFTLVPSAGLPQSRIVALKPDAPQEPPRVLTEGFFAACTPAVSYDGQRVLFAGKRSEADPWQIWEMRADGARLRQVTRGPGDAVDPCYLPDGRIVFSGQDRQDRHALYTCSLDGARVTRITFSHSDDRKSAVLPDGRILFRRTIRDAEEGVPMTVNTDGTGLQRFYGESGTAARQPEEWVVSRRASADETYGLYAIDEAAHQAWRLLYRDDEADAVDPVIAGPRTRPRALTSVVDESKQTGRLLCLNVYLSRLPEVAVLKTGEVTAARIVAVQDDLQERPIVEVKVEEDGSFYVELPADTPLRLRLLGSDGRVVAALESEIWVRPNEIRGCIGCHEDPELAPENRIPLAVTKPFVSPQVTMEKHNANQE